MICEIFHVWYIQLSSVALPEWINEVSQKVRDHLINKLLERVGGASLPKLIMLLSLMVIGVVKVEMHIYANKMWSHNRWVRWLDGCGQLYLRKTFLKLVAIVLAKFFFNITWSNDQWIMSLVGLGTLTLNHKGYSKSNRTQ